MFRLDEELNTWVPHNLIGTYTEIRTLYGDSVEEFPEGAEVTPIQLTAEQTKRLNSVKADSTVSLHDLIAYVMEGEEIPGFEKYETQAAFDSFIQSLPPEHVEANAEAVIDLVAPWKRNVRYEKDTYVRYKGGLYRVLQSHESQEDWGPDVAHSLFASVLTSPDGEPLEWVQPDSTNPYMKGDKVLYKGVIWTSLIDANVTIPDGDVPHNRYWTDK